MAILTKNALSASNQASFPNNTTGAITPQILRDFNQDVIDTLVDSLNTGSYAITTGSNDFTQPNNFTSISASSFVSASVFVGDGSKLTNITASVAIPISDEGILQGYATQLNFSGSNISASLQAGIATISVNTNNLVTTSSFNSYTSSNDSKVNSLISATASYANSASVAAVDAAQQSQINSLIAATSSLALTSLNAFTASQETKDTTLGLYTASVDQKFTNIGGQSGSWDNTSLNAFTASQNTKNSTLATYTASVDTKFSNIGSQSASWDNTNLNSFTSSQNTKNSTLASYTGSNDTKWNTLGGQSGSWVTESETGSFARTNVNNVFTVEQTFTNISASGFLKGLYFQGGTAYVDTMISQFANSDITVFLPNNTFAVSSSISATGTFTSSLQQGYVWVGDSNNRTTLVATSSFAGTPTNITSLNAFTASQDTKNATLANVTASLQQQLTNIGGQSGSWITESETASFARTNVDNNFSVNQTFTNITAVSASFQYVQTTYETSSVIYSSGSNQFGDELSDIQTLSGSVKVQGTLTINGLPVATGSTDISSLNAFTASQETKNSTLATYTASVNSQLSSLNSFTASQETKNSTLATYTASVDSSLTNLNSFTASNGNTSLNSYTQSNDTKWSNLAGQTGSYVTSAITASSLVTASVNLNTITFTKGDASTFNITVNTGSGGGTSDLTSLNAFTASQETKDTTLASVTSSLNTATASLFTSTSLSLTTASFDSGTRNLTFTKGNTTQFSVNIPDASGSTETIYDTVYTGESITKGDPLYISGSQGANPIVYKANAADPLKMPVTYVSNQTIGAANTTSAIILGHIEGIDLTGYTAGQAIYVAEGGGWSTSLPSGSNSVTQLLGIVTKAGSGGKGLVLNPGPAQLPGLDTGKMWVGNGNNQPIEITTASFATTGSNVFTGDQTLVDPSGNTVTLTDGSGSLILVAKSYTSASTHLSSSVNQVNLIFKNNNNTADTIISGSGNMFINPATPTTGFKRYVGGSGNIALHASNIPQISSSMAFSPIMNNNYFGAAGTTLTMRGPVSSSTWNIIGNNILGTVNIGTSAALNAEKLTSGLTMANNSIGGTLNIIANSNALTGSATTFSSNIIAGTTQLSLISSTINGNNNIINDSGFIFTNQFYSSSLGLGSVAFNRNNIGGQSNAITVSGSLPAGITTANSISDNFIFGGSNTIYVDVANARVSGSSLYVNAIRNGLMGNGLVVSGSSLLSDASSYGSVFVGRYNADDNRRNKTSDVVFAVGTGTDAIRKTGFLIDSGSNTFVEGTLNVSGATSLNGNLIITGSLTASLQQGYVWVGDASGKTITVATSSFGGTLPNNLISSSAQITALGFVSSSVTASSVVTASVNLNTITFTKGDASTFALTVNTGSGGGGGAAFPYTGNAVITGSLGVSGSIFGGVVELSVVSTTASVDFSAGNMFTLTLPSASTHIIPTNIRAGQTVNIQITQPTPGTGSVTFSPLVLFAGGNDYQATATGSAVDMLTLVSFNGTNTIAAGIKNLL